MQHNDSDRWFDASFLCAHASSVWFPGATSEHCICGTNFAVIITS